MRPKVMLVDDSETVLMMEKMILARNAFSIVLARNGAEALEKAVVERPDLILLDVMMPTMNGIEACRRLRAMPETRDTPIIIVTTRGEMNNVEAGYASGCSDYITKPIDGTELLAKIRSLLSSATLPA